MSRNSDFGVRGSTGLSSGSVIKKIVPASAALPKVPAPLGPKLRNVTPCVVGFDLEEGEGLS